MENIPSEFRKFLPDDDSIKEKQSSWELIFEKYSNAGDDENIGVKFEDVDKFYEGQEEEEDEDGNESVVAADFESDEKESEEEVIEDANLLDTIDNGHAKTTFRIDDEWLKNLQCAFDLRREELSKMNLPFWEIETESARVQESLKENTFKTPSTSLQTKNLKRLTQLHRSRASAIESPQLMLNTFKFPQKPSMTSISMGNNSEMQLPPPILRMLESGKSFNLSICEREYQIQFVDNGNAGSNGITDSIAETSKLIAELNRINEQGESSGTEVKKQTRKKRNSQAPTTALPKKKTRAVRRRPLRPKSTLDDISCGSSCSTVTSDDEKHYQLEKYDKMRTEKKTEHKQKKLIERTKLGESAISNDLAPFDQRLLEKKDEKENESPSSSDDDFFWSSKQKAERAEKKLLKDSAKMNSFDSTLKEQNVEKTKKN